VKVQVSSLAGLNYRIILLDLRFNFFSWFNVYAMKFSLHDHQNINKLVKLLNLKLQTVVQLVWLCKFTPFV
jgi:hypothetical protein